MQRLRVRFAKRGRLRFTSHRDFQRAFERAVRRAGVPIAHSAGFSPHPRISYAGAAPTGAASEAEYLELALSARREPEQLRLALDRALPPGLDVLEVVEATGIALADRLQASIWQVELPGITGPELDRALAAFLAADRVEVQRLTKSGIRTFDARGAVLWARQVDRAAALPAALPGAMPAEPGAEPAAEPPAGPGAGPAERAAQVQLAPCAILHMVVRHTTPAVRPDDVLAALRSQADLAPPSPPRMTRLAQGPLDEVSGAVADPLAPGESVAGT